MKQVLWFTVCGCLLIAYLEVSSGERFLQISQKRTRTREEKLLQNFISSRDGPVKVEKQLRQRVKHARLPYYGVMAEKNGKN